MKDICPHLSNLRVFSLMLEAQLLIKYGNWAFLHSVAVLYSPLNNQPSFPGKPRKQRKLLAIYLLKAGLFTLSKQKRETFPHTLMRGGLMQKIPCFLSRLWA